MLSRLVGVAGLFAGVITGMGLAASPAAADCSGGNLSGCGGGDDGASAGSSGNTVNVRVYGTLVGQGNGGSGGGSTTVSVPSPCKYSPGFTGKEYYEWVKSGRANYAQHHSGLGAYEPHEGYEDHKDDTEGRWYGASCSSADYEAVYGEQANLDAFFDYADAWFATHDGIYVEAGEDPPTPPIPPEALRYAAQQAMEIPEPRFAFNPDRAAAVNTIVNIPTWFWLTDPTLTGNVTAEAGGHSATVTAELTSFKVVSDDGDSTGTCAGTGTAWHAGAGATDSDCTITFRYPAGDLGVTATTTWGVSWAYDGAQQGTLAPVTSTWTDALSVGEVQTVVTDAR